MARTGMTITVTNTVLGNPPNVDSNSLLMISGCTAVTGGSMPFQLGTLYMLQSLNDLEALGVTKGNNEALYNQVSDYYSQVSGILWVVGFAPDSNVSLVGFDTYVRQTVANGFQYRPRNILISNETTDSSESLADYQTAINGLYADGFCVVVVVGWDIVCANIISDYPTVEDMSTQASPMCGVLGVTNRMGDRACVGLLGGWMASLSAGTSIGNATLPSLGNNLYWLDGTIDASGGTPVTTWVNTPCANLRTSILNVLGDKQWIFARTRPPRNGLWWNDGATATDPAEALSTLEAVRVLSSMCDALRSYFTPYINTNVPITNTGDIDPAYRSVVVDGARSQVIQPYIDAGDISDARLTLKALNNDFLGTRTWEVTLEVLPAASLRWIDGFVFYVSELI